ncbi:molybdopterin-synthase adenylyltransferase MoeB [Pedobacter sp. GSP4]|uniref:molybdopterin-synthase adenylyltransferase MoeB n=1 Tax=Pedobacter sp. GSP4 TaxID=3453716 RepID=UPI003EEC5B8E
MLAKEEIGRYNRQMILPEIGLLGQQKLKAARVLVIGAGGLGCPVLQYLAAAGIGEIGIVDDDLVALSNLHRQILYHMADIGKPKATIAKEKLLQLNPQLSVNSFNERFTDTRATEICQQYDLVIDCSDNFDTRYLVNDTCVALGKTLVFGSILKFEGQIAVFNHQGCANYRNLYPEPPTENISCIEGGVIGILPGLIGLYMANETIKLICGIGETLAGKLMTVDALNNTHYVFQIKREKPVEKPVVQALKNSISIKEIDQQTLSLWISESAETVFLIDVREDYEHEEHHIGGINISLYNLAESVALIPENKKVVFYCQTGQRSQMAAQLLLPIYVGEVYSLKGGLSTARKI